MLITYKLLKKRGACEEQAQEFRKLYPNGVQPTPEALIRLWAVDELNSFWLVNLLPREGQCSQRAWALFCVEQINHLITDKRLRKCLDIIRLRVQNPRLVSNTKLKHTHVKASDAADAVVSNSACTYAAYAVYDTTDVTAEYSFEWAYHHSINAVFHDFVAASTDVIENARNSMRELLLSQLAELLAMN